MRVLRRCDLFAFLLALLIPVSVRAGEFRAAADVRHLAAARVAVGTYPTVTLAIIGGHEVETWSIGFLDVAGGIRVAEDTIFEIGPIENTLVSLLLADATERGELPSDTAGVKAGEQGIVAAALAKRLGTSFEELLRSRVTYGLMMDDSGLTVAPQHVSRVAPGHDRYGVPLPFAARPTARSTLRDLVYFARSFLGTLAVPRPRPSGFQRVMDAGKVDDASLGWAVRTLAGAQVLWSGGTTEGFGSFIAISPSRGIAAIVLTNIQRDVSDLGFALLQGRVGDGRSNRFGLPPAPLRKFAGRYVDEARNEYVVSTDGVELSVQWPDGPADVVQANTPVSFLSVDGKTMYVFEANEDAEWSELTAQRDQLQIRARRADSPVSDDAANELDAYAGTYPVAPGYSLTIRLRDETLVFEAPDCSPESLIHESGDTFLTRSGSRLVFHRSGPLVESLTLAARGLEIQAPRLGVGLAKQW